MRSLALRANASAAPAVRPAALRGAPEEVKGDTSVVSTASCEPPQSASPLAMTSMQRSSWRATSTLRSRSRTLRATVAPASRQTRAAARSRGPPLARRTPDRGHAARWSPKRSCRSQGHRKAEPAEEQHAEERRAEGQLRGNWSGGEDTRGVRA